MAVIEAKTPDACISTSSPLYATYGPARCARLAIHPWSWNIWAPNIRVTLVDGDFNCGLQIGLCDWTEFPSDWGAAILDVNGGTIYTGGMGNVPDWNYPDQLDPNLPWIPGRGLWIGGGGSGQGANYGVLNIRNDGQMIVQKIILNNGDVNLYNGLLYQTEDDTASFSISQSHPTRNKINIEGDGTTGGELRLQGNRTEQVNYYASKGQICPCWKHGALYINYNFNELTDPPEANYTSVTAVCTPGSAWDPRPIDRATRQELSVTLTWKPGPNAEASDGDANYTHAVYFGMNYDDVYNDDTSNTYGTYQGSQDPCSFSVSGLIMDTSYYWRIDEYNDFNDPNIANDPCVWKGVVWQFKTKGPEAGGPNPATGTVGLTIPLQLTWSPGALTQETDGHVLFFGDSEVNVTDSRITNVLAGVTKVVLSSPIFQLSALDSNLVADTNYYWRVDQVNDACGNSPWLGPVWTFKNTNYFYVDNFDTYTSADDMNVRWDVNYMNKKCSYRSWAHLNWELVTSGEVTSGFMIYGYDNASGWGGSGKYFSEARLEVNTLPAGGADWTGGGALPDNDNPASIAVSYVGAPGNWADPTYDKMYMGLEANDGNIGFVSNPEAEAQRTSLWQDWEVNFTDVNCPSVRDRSDIRRFYLGFGLMCNPGSVGRGGTGTVRFDYIRLYQKHCVPAYAKQVGLTGDLSDDCKVNLADVNVLADNWLAKQQVVTVSSPNNADVNLMVWYKFDSTTGKKAVDATGHHYDGDVNSNETDTTKFWTTGGYDGNGCFNLTSQSAIDQNTMGIDACLASVSGYTKHAITFSFWIKTDYYMPRSGWPRFIAIFQDYNSLADDENEVMDVWCPIPRTGNDSFASFSMSKNSDSNSATSNGLPWSYFAGQWNHYALVKNADANLMRIYRDGGIIAENNQAPVGMFASSPPMENFRIGRFSLGAEPWTGKIDDFRVYNYALSQAEVAYIGTKGTGYVTFDNVANIKNLPSDGTSTAKIVDFKDYAVLANQWLGSNQPILWP
jgi:hypothetical protein